MDEERGMVAIMGPAALSSALEYVTIMELERGMFPIGTVIDPFSSPVVRTIELERGKLASWTPDVRTIDDDRGNVPSGLVMMSIDDERGKFVPPTMR